MKKVIKMKKTGLIKKNFYFAIFTVAILFAVSFVIATYTASDASHDTLYTDTIEPKDDTDVKIMSIVGIGKVPAAGSQLDVNGLVLATALTATGDIEGNRLCIATDCRTAWPAGGVADNLGDHTALQNIVLDSFWLSGDGNDEGISIDNDGDVGIGDDSPDGDLKLDVEGKVGATEYCDENGNNCKKEIVIVKTTTESKNTNVMAMDSDLKFYVNPDELWQFEIVALMFAHNVGGIKVSTKGPTIGTGFFKGHMQVTWGDAGVTSNTDNYIARWLPDHTVIIEKDFPDSHTLRIEIKGAIKTDSTHEGDFGFEWSQRVSDTLDTSVKEGSYLIARRIS